MKKIAVLTLLLLFINSVAVSAYDLATEISDHDGKVILSSIGYAKLGIIKLKTNSTGMVNLNGIVSISGSANIVMWAKVDGNYYFSKLPILQNIHDKKNVSFTIPFNAAEKTVTEIVLEVELLKGGKIEVSDIKLNG